MRRVVVGVAALAAVFALTAGGGASASKKGHSKSGRAAVVKMDVKGKDLGFTGPKTVEAGQKLKIVNKTSPKKVGPHTFSLVKKKDLPTTNKQMKDCEKLKRGVCTNIAKAHKLDPATFTINKPDVDAGKKGWDKSFGKHGDSWYTQKKGEKTTRKVSAKPGKILYYFCAVHPFMVGKVKVVR